MDILYMIVFLTCIYALYDSVLTFEEDYGDLQEILPLLGFYSIGLIGFIVFGYFLIL